MSGYLDLEQRMDTRDKNIDFLRANLGTVNHLISKLTPSNILTRMSLESRRDEIVAELAEAQRGATT